MTGAAYMSDDIPSNYPTTGPKLEARIKKVLAENLNNSSRTFVESIFQYYHSAGKLTERQLEAFQKIESRYSPQEKQKFNEWAEEYDRTYRADSSIIASYYIKAGYFITLASKIQEDTSFVPNKKDFLRMYSNKYAQKVLTATRSEPKFGVGDMVQLRATAGKGWQDGHLRKLKSRKCFVLENDLPVVNAVGGAKRYRVLPMGASEPLEIDERFLMKPNKRGRNS
jgi:hypothetical protein